MAITNFRGKYSFLSNFYNHTIIYNGYVVPTNEHAYQLMKACNKEDMDLIARQPNASSAKFISQHIKIRKDWDNIKLQIMEEVCRIKFSDKNMKDKLLSTGEEDLIETNWWSDTYWGVSDRTGEGQNHLGKILMKIRNDLKNKQQDETGTLS